MRRDLVALSILAFALHAAELAADEKAMPPSRDLESPDRMGERQMLEQIRMRLGHRAAVDRDRPSRMGKSRAVCGNRPAARRDRARRERRCRLITSWPSKRRRLETRPWRAARRASGARAGFASRRDVAPQLRRKGAPGGRRIALEFLKLESGGDAFGFDWQEEPDSAGNRAALARWNEFL